MGAPENAVQASCLLWLQQHRVFCWRQNQGAVPNGRGGYRAFAGLKGVSDILGVLPGGRLLAVEVKAAKGSVRKEQREFLAAVNAAGGLGLVVRSHEELAAAVLPLLEESKS